MSIFKFIEAKYDKKFDRDKVVIDFKELITRQMKINEKFPNPNRDSKYINVFDNMVGQINEEVYETNIELMKNIKNGYLQTEESYEEFIDAFMYSASLFCETVIYFNVEPLEWLKKNNLETLDIYDAYNGNAYFVFQRNVNEENKFRLDYTSVLRRKIYNRKYHKRANKKPVNYVNDLLKSIVVGSYMQPSGLQDIYYSLHLAEYYMPEYIDNFYKYMNNLFFCYDFGYNPTINKNMILERIDKLNEIIDGKEEFITNL